MLQAASRTVLAHGCFDLLHLGHIRHLQEARSLGDRLVVSITADKHVNKGHGRPQFSAEQRREALLALACVDAVIISESGTAAEIISQVKPAVYAKGGDYVGSNDPGLLSEIAAIEGVGGRFYITTSEKWSSTRLLRNVRLPEATLAYLETARRRGFLDSVLAAFEKADKLRIAFVGETIIDEYRYVKPLAKPSKEFILATVAVTEERFEGGVMAAAKHGDWPLVNITTSDDAITKTRYVDADFSRKLFEIYSARELPPKSDPALWAARRNGAIQACDVAIVYDFGHGLLNAVDRKALSQAKFLAVTAQSNAGNWGFNSVKKYERADYVCVDEPEARMAAGDQDGPLLGVMTKLSQYTKAKTVTVTRGRYGSVSYAPSLGPPKDIPAFADSGFDTMGAGDAFLAVASPLIAAGLDVEMAAFVGNVAGGLKTAILGHRQHVGRNDIIKNLEWLLK
jgi:rfaE bifunctional protein nucleotidyltransferase chain/domain